VGCYTFFHTVVIHMFARRTFGKYARVPHPHFMYAPSADNFLLSALCRAYPVYKLSIDAVFQRDDEVVEEDLSACSDVDVVIFRICHRNKKVHP